ncbi:hypothetical protein AMTRI_Chr03g146680 [Amborella trichopoda]
MAMAATCATPTSSYSPFVSHHQLFLLPRKSSNFITCKNYLPQWKTSVNFTHLVGLCNTSNEEELHQIHAQTIKAGAIGHPIILNNLLLSFCSLSSSPHLEYARSLVFHSASNSNTFAWNSLIRAYSKGGFPDHSFSLFCECLQRSVLPDHFTFPIVAGACAMLSSFEQGRALHAQAIKMGFDSEDYTVNSLVHMYAKCGSLESARLLFDRSCCRDVVSWTAMVSGYAKSGELGQARKLFDEMPESNTVSWTAMIDGYAKAGDMNSARVLFDRMPKRDIVSWGAMISGYLQVNRPIEVLALFRDLQRISLKLDGVIVIGVLSACASLGALDQGEWIHNFIFENRIQLDPKLITSLIDMYGKCGSIDRAFKVFSDWSGRALGPWNAMIAGFAMHGRAQNAINLFLELKKVGLRPDDITFIGLLNACAHAGLVEEGREYFSLIKGEYELEPKIEHYGCMVDLLSRMGLVDEAEELVESMPMEPDAIIWGTLVSACRIHGNVDVGERGAKRLIELEPENGGRYVLLSNTYAMAGRWERVGGIRKVMKERSLVKTPGCTSIVIDGVVHEFVAGDTRHPQTKDIYCHLGNIFEELRALGYAPSTSNVLLDIEDGAKKLSVAYHSEKLAIAFGLINMGPGTTFHIFKNLRFCEDCHRFMKLVSNFFQKEIIARDRIRFHHFKEGVCSCMDFW